MAGWKDNTIMLWAGNKVTDHGRKELQEKTERIGSDKRMFDGTLRRQHIGVKRTWEISWDNLPSTNSISTAYKTADGGLDGMAMEDFFYATPGKFRLVLKRGSALNQAVPNPAESALPFEDANFYIVNVMFTQFSKDVVKRGKSDMWNVSVTLEEV